MYVCVCVLPAEHSCRPVAARLLAPALCPAYPSAAGPRSRYTSRQSPRPEPGTETDRCCPAHTHTHTHTEHITHTQTASHTHRASHTPHTHTDKQDFGYVVSDCSEHKLCSIIIWRHGCECVSTAVLRPCRSEIRARVRVISASVADVNHLKPYSLNHPSCCRLATVSVPLAVTHNNSITSETHTATASQACMCVVWCVCGGVCACVCVREVCVRVCACV